MQIPAVLDLADADTHVDDLSMQAGEPGDRLDSVHRSVCIDDLTAHTTDLRFPTDRAMKWMFCADLCV